MTARHWPPTLGMNGAEQLMVRADEIKRLVLDGSPSARLTDAFRGHALNMLEALSMEDDQRGLRIEERNSDRRLVFWDPRADEAVLQVVAQRRLVTADQPSATWAATVRQWWARLLFADGSWWVVDQEDLTPDRWRPVPQGAG
jgi:hypothetical protein